MKLLLETENSLRVIADSAIARNNQPWFLPDCGSNWRWTLALGFRIAKLGKNISPKFAQRYIDATTLIWVPEADSCSCLDYMDGAVVCGTWIPVTDFPERAGQMLSRLSSFSTMKTGDIIAYPLPQTPTPIEINQHISQSIDNVDVLNFNIK